MQPSTDLRHVIEFKWLTTVTSGRSLW